MKKGAIFDMDGLLFDTERLYREAWMELAREYGQTPNPEFPKAVSGTNGEYMLEVIRTYYPAIDAERFRDSCIARVDGIVKQAVPEKPGVHQILKGLKGKGVRLAVASSSPIPSIEYNLRKAGIDSYFDVVVSGTQVEHGKPAPDIFLLAAEKLGVAPGDCYVFEDSFNGIRAGAAAGCATVMIPDQVAPTREIASICTGIYSNLLLALEAMIAGAL